MALTLVGVALTAGPAAADDPVTSGAMSTEIILKKGSKGAAVKAVQRKLGLTPDGKFGPATVRAVKQFQKRNGLDADGIVGPSTRRAMSLPAFKSNSVTRTKRGSRVKIPAKLRAIADCESGGDITAVSRNGMYFGKYQFSKATWKRMGGRGTNPAKATEAEQDRVALKLYRASDPDTQWPVCSKQA